MRVLSALVIAAALCACGEDETIVSVNVNSSDEVGNPSSLVITISQPGQTAVVQEIMPPTRAMDSGTTIQPMFFERVSLPEAWAEEKSEVKVEAKKAGGVYLTASKEFTVRPGGAVAVFIDLGKKPMMMEPGKDDAGMDDAGL